MTKLIREKKKAFPDNRGRLSSFAHGAKVISISIFQSDAEWEGDVEAMLGAVAFNAAAVIEEILQAWLYVEADVRRDVVLDADTHGCGPLKR